MQKGIVQEDETPQEILDLVQPHIESYDYFLGEGLQRVVENIDPVEVEHVTTKHRHRFWFENPVIGRPLKDLVTAGVDERLFPTECREAGVTYKAPFQIDVCYQREGQGIQRLVRRLGNIPIMVRSGNCYLRRFSRKQMVRKGEEANEMGGYFICNGIERVLRMLIQQRRHYIMALRRGAYENRGRNFTNMATLIRCVRPDESSAQIRCHYLKDGLVNVAFIIRRAEFFVPAGILLKCFVEVSDRELFAKIAASSPEAKDRAATFREDRAELLIRQAVGYGLHTRAKCVEYLGEAFRTALDVPSRRTDYQVGEELLRQCIFIHLEHPADKLNLMLTMLHKLYALVSDQICEDNPDALNHQELILAGHLMMRFVKENLEANLAGLKANITNDMGRNSEAVMLTDEKYIKKVAEKMPDIGRKVEYLLNTGNMTTRFGIDISQNTGFTVVAEKLNFFRYLSHFRSVHRGAYFAELRTTTVRKLLPESWGFMCPVHTPDGSPCGLLNHLTAACKVAATGPESPEDTAVAVTMVMVSLGMMPAVPALVLPPFPMYVAVMLDGRVIGHVRSDRAPRIVARLRAIKAAALSRLQRLPPDAKVGPLQGPEKLIPAGMEVAHLPFERGSPFPGIFLFTAAARFLRPVRQVASRAPELIGSLEQAHMGIRCPDGGAGGSRGQRFTHEEFGTGAMLSVVAGLTPYSDYNQSPRNMYQCQMAKQTMGTPAQALVHRPDGKMYRIHTPQTPLARTHRYDAYKMDEFPNGTNAIVAVLAYTGYDMEDAMILCKSAVDRGFAHGTLYKTDTVDLRTDNDDKQQFFAPDTRKPRFPKRDTGPPKGAFGEEFPQNITSQPGNQSVKDKRVRPSPTHQDPERIDYDGLPYVGAAIWPGQTYYSTQDKVSKASKGGKLKGEEVGIVDQVTIIGAKANALQKAAIKMRISRNPVIGDKFSSRHGQKGVLSQHWPDADMPFCARTGIRPDLLINPHAFPSRMTIGMLVESMVGKAGALQGKFVDASPFQSSDGIETDPIQDFGEALEQAGFARHGGETMVSGITGEEFAADIFVGPVYYQRLRHMVSDKFQVRSTGPVNKLTRQPVKGRKLGGGIRFGEMERDALLAHGAAYLLHDRLHTCSDYDVTNCCSSCGSILSPTQRPVPLPSFASRLHQGNLPAGKATCRICGDKARIERVALPYVFRYLLAELAVMNIKLSLSLQ